MIKYQFMKFSILLAILLWGSFNTYAQNYESAADKVFEFIANGQGDSIYTHFNEKIRARATPETFNSIFHKLEERFGAYQSKGEWQRTAIESQNMYYCDLVFKNSPLRLLVAFDPDGKVNTIRFIPVPHSASVPVKNDKFSESSIEIVSGKYKLPGTMSYPNKITKAPVAILVHGSGPNDRDETVGVNKPFRDIAWGLADRGIAVIRYDKRTFIYGSKWKTLEKKGTFDDETIDDAIAAIKWAKKNPQFDTNQIYLIGHSLGAMLAPRIAQKAPELAGIIMLSGNARPLENVILDQVNYLSSLQDSSDKDQKQRTLIKEQIANLKNLGTKKYDEKIGLPLNLNKAYWQFAEEYNQVKVAKKLKLPIFILQGERDYQVTMTDFNMWRSSLKHNRNVTFKSYPQLNHLYQEGKGKSIPSEYAQKASIPEYVIKDISQWIKDSDRK